MIKKTFLIISLLLLFQPIASAINVENNLIKYKLQLPEITYSMQNHASYIVSDNQIYVSTQFAEDKDSGQKYIGKVGKEFTLAQAEIAAVSASLKLLSHLKHAIDGDWKRLARTIKITVYVNIEDSCDIDVIADAASDVINKALGSKGTHIRAVFGLKQLAHGQLVGVEGHFELYPQLIRRL
jgi:enamine deaminase RidA (YjgF/YER057c/UK114 family)